MYVSLARKYRPTSFEDIIGHDAIVKGLSHALDNNTFPSAYLLTGTRGIGKTTLARLIALALNCQKGSSSQPCHNCDQCISSLKNNNPDIYEVDGASKTKVEDIKTLLESTQYMPLSGKYKVYIIDEVHMLSSHAFNALLKTLEEPQKHTIFILATTEAEKIPITIRSRCAHYALLPFTTEKILNRLKYILEEENVDYEDSLIEIARAGRGSMRDAITLLEQVIQIGAGHVTNQAIQQLLNTVHDQNWHNWIEKLKNPNKEEFLLSVEELETHKPQAKDFIERLLKHWHECAVDNIEQTDFKLYDITLNSLKQLALAPNQDIHLQMLWLRLWQVLHHGKNITIQIVHKKDTIDLSSIPSPRGMLGEAYKYLKLVKTQENNSTISYPENQQALFSTSLINKLKELLKQHYPQHNFIFIPEATNMIIQEQQHDSFSKSEKSLLAKIGYTS